MPWQEGTLQMQMPAEISATVDTIDAVKTAVDPLLSALVQLLNAAKFLYVEGVDPLAAVADAAIQELTDIINDFFSSGFFFLEVRGDTVASPNYLNTAQIEALIVSLGSPVDSAKYRIPFPTLTPEEAINNAVQSLDDTGDLKRPQFSNDAQIAGLGVLLSVGDSSTLLSLVKSLNLLLNLNSITKFVNKYSDLEKNALNQSNDIEVIVFSEINTALNQLTVVQSWPTDSTVTVQAIEGDLPGELIEEQTYFITQIDISTITLHETKGGPIVDLATTDPDVKFLLQPSKLISVLPDWSSIKLENFNNIADLKILLTRSLSQLKGYISIANEAIGGAIEIYEEKLNQLIAVSTALQAFIDGFDSLFMADIQILDIPSGVGGNTRLKNELNSLDYSAIANNQFSYFILFVGGGTSVEAFEKFKEFFV